MSPNGLRSTGLHASQHIRTSLHTACCRGSACRIIASSSLAVLFSALIAADLAPAKCYAVFMPHPESTGPAASLLRLRWHLWMYRRNGATSPPTWNLKRYFPYSSVFSASLYREVLNLNRAARRFEKAYRGQVSVKLVTVLHDYAKLANRLTRVRLYVDLNEALPTNEATAKRIARRRLDFQIIDAKLNFLTAEICAISDDTLNGLRAASNGKLAQFEDYIRWVRRVTCRMERLSLPYQDGAAENLERAATIFEFRRCLETLRVPLDSTSQSYEAAVALLRSSDPVRRNQAARAITLLLRNTLVKSWEESCPKNVLFLRGVGDGCRQRAVAVLNHVAAWSAQTVPVSDDQDVRLVIQIRHDLDEETVISIEKAGETTAVELVRRYYKLKRRILLHKCGLKHFGFKDRFAPLPIKAGTHNTRWQDAVQTVHKAFAAFSAPMVELFQSLLMEERIDAAPLEGKQSSRCFSGLFKNGPFIELQYRPGTEFLFALAHEASHGIHVLMSAKKSLQPQAPSVLSEMFALLGEIILFQYMVNKAATKEERLAHLLHYMEDWKSKVVVQLVLHRFEAEVHKARNAGPLTADKIDALYMTLLRTFYGQDGEVFDDFEGAEASWPILTSSLITPFYVFSYAAAQHLAEIFYKTLGTAAGAASRARFFSILKANSSTVLQDVLQAFGVNIDEQFWSSTQSVARNVLDEAEKLAEELGMVEGGTGPSR